MISPLRMTVPQPIKTLFVPALGVGALYANMQTLEEGDQPMGLAKSMALTASSVYLQRVQNCLLPLCAGIVMWARAKQEDKGERAKLVGKDLVWLGSGIAAQSLLSSRAKDGSRQWFLHNCCGFAIGAYIIAPYLNKLIFQKKDERDFNRKMAELAASNAYPISMDKYGILSKVIKPLNKHTHENNSVKE